MDKRKILHEQAMTRELTREFQSAFTPEMGKVYDDPRVRAFSNPNETKQNSKPVITEQIKYHTMYRIPLSENVFRIYSANYFKLFNEARELYKVGMFQPMNEFDKEMLDGDIGKVGIYENTKVLLDVPFIMKEEEEEKELNKPKRGGPKKFYVFVKDGDSIKKVTFGDTTGLDVNFDDEKARKSFVARHNCSDKTDKTTAGYWSCRLPKFASSLGLSNGGDFFW